MTRQKCALQIYKFGKYEYGKYLKGSGGWETIKKGTCKQLTSVMKKTGVPIGYYSMRLIRQVKAFEVVKTKRKDGTYAEDKGVSVSGIGGKWNV